MMAHLIALVSFLLVSAGSLVSGISQCVPTTITLEKGSIMGSSADRQYVPGDIFYRNCSEPDVRQYVGWCPDTHDQEPKLQITLPYVSAIYAIVFQTTLTECAEAHHDYSREPFLMEFDLHYVLPEDNGGTLILYQQNMKALDGKSAEKMVAFPDPLMTTTLSLRPTLSNIYPCFRFKVIGCKAEGLCDQGYCLNGGKCVGHNYCKCEGGYLGDRCNQTLDEVTPYDYGFQTIENNVLTTPDGVFDVVGDVSLDLNRRRDDHHDHHHDHHHGHSCHFHSHHHHHSYCQYNSHHSHPSSNHHNSGHSSSSSTGGHSSSSSTSSSSTNHCMSQLSNHHHGFTTTMNFNHGQDHHGHCYLYSNGGHLQNHNGASLSFNSITQTLNFVVSTITDKWSVSAPCHACQTGVTNNVATSWHPQTGAHIYVNDHHVGGCGQGTPHATPHNHTVELRIGDGHVSIDINVKVNISISGLNMYPTSAAKLNNAGVTTFTAAPPPTQPTTAAPVTATTTHNVPPTTTMAPVTATTTHSGMTAGSTVPTTTGAHRPVCYSYDNQNTIGALQTSTRCNVGEVCTLYEDNGGYTAKCLPRSLCESGRRLAGTKCFECCDTYLCNDRCSASTSQQCADKPTCGTMMATGYDVCSDPVMAYDMCMKTCSIC